MRRLLEPRDGASSTTARLLLSDGPGSGNDTADDEQPREHQPGQPALSSEEEDELRKLFDEIDTDGGGTLDHEEIEVLLRL